MWATFRRIMWKLFVCVGCPGQISLIHLDPTSGRLWWYGLSAKHYQYYYFLSWVRNKDGSGTVFVEKGRQWYTRQVADQGFGGVWERRRISLRQAWGTEIIFYIYRDILIIFINIQHKRDSVDMCTQALRWYSAHASFIFRFYIHFHHLII